MKDKKIAIIQSNYIPWKGYFDIINRVNEFILYDNVQYTQRDWRNRNKIKTPEGLRWLTIPVEVKGKYFQKINETKIAQKDWGKRHWNKILQNYSKAKYFKDYKKLFEDLYLSSNEKYLSQINYKFIKVINKILNIATQISWLNDYEKTECKTKALLHICKKVGATEYISGTAAKDYIEEELFKQEKIKLTWFDYSDYQEYNQLYPPFEHNVSIIDLIFNEGPNAAKFMRSFKN
ncbi:MAG: WbqC family protein [bacterium]